MMKISRAIGHTLFAVVLLLACGSALVLVRQAAAEGPAGAADGTLHIRELTIPPSQFWSPEFKAIYGQMVARMRAMPAAAPDPHPARDAPKAEWDQFDADINGQIAEPLARALKRYPAEVQDTRMAGVHVGIISPKGGVAARNKGRVLINLHGGGFVDFRGLSFGQLESIPVASLGKIKVITVDYRQSPYFQYPAANEDVEAVYRGLLQQYRPESIGIYGCSAGGALTAQTVAWFQAKRLPRPGAVGVFCSAPPSTQRRAGDAQIWGLAMIPEDPVRRAVSPVSGANSWYMESAKLEDPRAYPGSFDEVLAKFPPVLLLTGTREAPLSSAAVSHAKFLKLGVDSSLYVMEGAWHAAHVTAVDTPEAQDANAYIARWFDEHLAR